MFKIGEKRKFSFGDYVVWKKIVDINFQVFERGRFYNIVQLYLMKGSNDIYLGVSDRDNILKLTEDKIPERLK